MKQPFKIIFTILLILCIGQLSFAKQGVVDYATINGLFAEKATAEIVIIQKINGRSVVLVQYNKDQSQDRFSVRFPVVADAVYEMKVNLLKQGARRMELDNVLTMPIQPQAGQVITYAIKPSVFDQGKGTGISETKNMKAFSSLTIHGAFKNWYSGGQFILSRVVDGQIKPVQTVNLDKNNPAFYFRVPLGAECFYYIGTVGWQKRIYVKPNDSLQVNVDGGSHELQWIHTTNENDLLTQWQSLIEPITNWGYERSVVNVKALNLDSFTQNYQQIQQAIGHFKLLVSGPNPTFNRLLKTAIAVDNQFTALKVLYYLSAKKFNGHNMPPKEYHDIPGYYKETLLSNAVTSTRVMQVGEGRDYLDLLTKFSLVTIDENKRAQLTTAERLQVMIKAIRNDTLRAVFLNEQLQQTEINNLREFKEVFEPLQKYATTPDIKKKYNQVYGQFIGDTAFIGKPAWDFTLPDTAGNMVSMKDFKGKVVLIDVWATWCGPCKAEFPFLKEIEDAYHDNANIVFVGISVDKAEKKDSWLALIQKEKLGGIQLLDDMGKGFGRKYGITSIPRFMLIDKQGRWVEVRCPRPGDAVNLKRYINEALGR